MELAMSRIADYLELETEKAVGILHSLLTPSGTWSLGDRHASDYLMILQKTIMKNYQGLNAEQMEEVKMLTAGPRSYQPCSLPGWKGTSYAQT